MTSAPIEAFLDALRQSLADGSFVGLTLGKYRGVAGGARKVTGPRVVLQGGERLSFTHRFDTRDETQNLAFTDAEIALRDFLGRGYRAAVLFTSSADVHLEVNRRGEGRLWRGRATAKERPPPTHDRPK